MKKTRESHALGALLGGSTYTEEQYGEDIESVRQEYLKRGYLDVSFGPPQMSYEDGHSRSFLFWKRPKRWMDITIPVVEGEQYRVGEVTVEGAEVLPAEIVRGFFPLVAGAVYDESQVNDGLESLREIYGARGYVQFTGFPTWRRREEPETGEKIVDVVVNLAEEDQFLVNRIEFRGNSTTKDRVIRREMWLNEQDIMNMELLKASIQRINQLGYFRPIEQPEIQPSPEDETKLDITLDLVEENRNQLTFGAGVSGLEGFFANASFGTTNFLGRGETANFTIQAGNRTQNYQIAITDPYFMDKPVTLGFDVFRRTLKLREFTRDDIGGRIVFGLPIGRWSRAFLNYGYSVITVREPDPDIVLNLYDLYYNSTYLDPRFFGLSGNFRESKISPTYVYNTVDHPIFPEHREETHRVLRCGRRPAGRECPLLQADARGRAPYPAHGRHLARTPRDGELPPRVWRGGSAGRRTDRHLRCGADRRALLQPVLHGRRVPDPRLLHPLRGPPERGRPVARREQDAAVQRGVRHTARRAAARHPVLRRRQRLRRGDLLGFLHAPELPHLDRDRDARLHPDAECAVPAHLRLQSPPGLLPPAYGVRLRDRNDLLGRIRARRPETPRSEPGRDDP